MKKRIGMSAGTSQLLMAILSCLLVGVLPARGEDIAEVEALKFKRDVAFAELDKPLEKLQGQYVAKLEELQQTAQSEGDLDRVLAIRREAENFKTSPEVAHPSVERQRRVYIEAAKKLRAERRVREHKLATDFADALEELVVELTRAGRPDDAAGVRDLAQSARATAQSMAVGGTSVALGSLSSAHCKLRPVAEGLEITSKDKHKRFAWTPKSYQPPFRYRAVAIRGRADKAAHGPAARLPVAGVAADRGRCHQR